MLAPEASEPPASNAALPGPAKPSGAGFLVCSRESFRPGSVAPNRTGHDLQPTRFTEEEQTNEHLVGQ